MRAKELLQIGWTIRLIRQKNSIENGWEKWEKFENNAMNYAYQLEYTAK